MEKLVDLFERNLDKRKTASGRIWFSFGAVYRSKIENVIDHRLPGVTQDLNCRGDLGSQG
jgi:hypothetical protein